MRNETMKSRGLAAGLGLLVAAAGCTTVDTHPEKDRIGAAPAVETAKDADSATPARPPAFPPSGPLPLSLQETTLLVLEQNRGLAVERLNPQIQRTAEEQARSVFDPVLNGGYSMSRSRADQTSTTPGVPTVYDSETGYVGLSQFLPFGTTLSGSASTTTAHDPGNGPNDVSTGLGLSATQPLLRGFGTGVNLASLRKARLDTAVSQYELRGYAELLVADTERAYWDAVLGRMQIEIYQDSLALAEKQLAETRERVTVGKLAATELTAAEAEVALRREDLINARSDFAKSRVRLLRLLNPADGGFWNRELDLRTHPAIQAIPVEDPAPHVARALRQRPEMNQARLQIRRNDITLVQTRNGLLPKLDFFITLGQSGYANSFRDARRNNDGSDYDVTGGVKMELPPLNRDARAQHTRALLTRRQAAESLANLSQTVEEEIRNACIEIERAYAQVQATAATRKLQEEKLRVETEKFRVGKSTSLLVGQAQRDLLSSQIAEVRAVIAHLTGVVELHRLEGSLLTSRGIDCPGAAPAE